MQVADERVTDLVKEYARRLPDRRRPARGTAAATTRCGTRPASNSGLRDFLTDGGFGAFTTNFEDLGGLRQLPGLAVQRLMADGYGFGGEGDWKTATPVEPLKVMSAGLPGRHVASWRTTPTTSNRVMN